MKNTAKKTPWKKILVNSCFTLALVTGMSVDDVSRNAVCNLGWEEIKLPNPVFIGDTIYCQSKVLEKRVSNSRPEAGIIKIETIGKNQQQKNVIELKRNIMIYKKDFAP